MIQITPEFKENVIAALLDHRNNYDGSDAAFAKKMGINSSVFSRIKSGEKDSLLNNAQWLNIGRELDVSAKPKKWVFVRTEVYTSIEEEVLFCKEHSKAMMFVDDCDIGKTVAGKHLSRTLKNCFYVDCTQAKTKQLFIRLIAKTIGIESEGKYATVKANIKYYLKLLPNPILYIDEWGDLEYAAFLELKELWNATEGVCGWYLTGAEGARHKLENGITAKKVGYREIFRRFNNKFSSVVPVNRSEKIDFYRKLITDVVSANISDKRKLNEIVKSCLTMDENGNIGGLTRADSLIILNAA